MSSVRNEWGSGSNSPHDRNGFTLIELLVVISIMALLIAILLPALSAAREEGKATKCGAELHSIGIAMTACQNDYNGFFPMWDDGARNTVQHGIIATWLEPVNWCCCY